MNLFIEHLKEAGFSRTNIPLDKPRPLVVHAVAGAGKSTLIRKYLLANPNSRAFTHGVPDPPNILNTYIHSYRSPTPDCFNILDEYPNHPVEGNWDVLIADPLQAKLPALRPHYVLTESYRLSKPVTDLLSTLGFQLSSRGFTSTQVFCKPLLGSSIHGKVLHLDAAARTTLSAHHCPSTCPTEVLGQEFEVVSVVSNIPLREVLPRSKLYIALSRATKELHVLSPDYSHPPT